MKNTTKFAQKNRETILPVHTAQVINDVVAVLLFALSALLMMSLISYSPYDICWFRVNSDAVFNIHNWLGPIGSYTADIIYTVFGISGIWLAVGIFYLGFYKIIRTKIEIGNFRSALRIMAFLVLLFGSSLFEYMCFSDKSTTYLHYGYGGMLGRWLFVVSAIRPGSFLVTSGVFFACVFCLFYVFDLSYLRFAELTGLVIEKSISAVVNLFRRDDALTEEMPLPRQEIAFAGLDDSLDEDIGSHKKSQIILDKQESLPFIDEDVLDAPLDVPGLKTRKSGFLHNLVYSDKGDLSKGNKRSNTRGAAQVTKPVSSKSHNQLLPSTDLLATPKKQVESVSGETIEFVSMSIENKLAEFGVEAKITNAESGPVITRYELLPSRGVRGDKIVGLGKEIARGLALTSVRVVETIPGKNSMGIEVPNFKRQTIYLKEIFNSDVYRQSQSKLTLALGRDIAGNVVVMDLAKMPHLLIAGTTGSGKSVAVNAMILSILFQATSDEVKFIMIDPKMVELSFYHDIPHLLVPVVTDMMQAANALKWAVAEMERRYRIMANVGCKSIYAFNAKVQEALDSGEPLYSPLVSDDGSKEELAKWPYIVVIIDELADLMMVTGKKIEQYIARLAQKARAIGIHLIVATQRPSVDVITGLIKANIPARISFQVSSKIDSRTILDQMGAESLLGQGDMLVLAPGSGLLERVHGAYVNDDELHRVVEYLKSVGSPEYVDEILTGDTFGAEIPGLDEGGTDSVEKDTIFDEAVKFIYDSRRCSISSLQTRFGIGYNRAARIMSHLEQIGMVKRNDRGGFEILNATGNQ